MGKTKFDGVVESVHYNPEGQVKWVRVYRRRGPTFSDRLLMNRDEFIRELKSGRRYFSGKRIALQASTFDLGEQVSLLQRDGSEYIVIGEQSSEKDFLKGVPII
jgi:hypothetical protein